MQQKVRASSDVIAVRFTVITTTYIQDPHGYSSSKKRCANNNCRHAIR